MREPTVRARHTRQQRLLRTAIVTVILVASAALLVNALTGGKDGPGGGPEGTPQVAFKTSVKGETDATKKVATKRAKAEGEEIAAILNDWYQRAFVDPSLFGDGTFLEVARYFAPEAQAAFTKDITSFTIGQAREEVERVQPSQSTVQITVFFERGDRPKLATAAVRFRASATLKAGGPPLEISQKAVLTFKKVAKGWQVVYYTVNAHHKQTPPPTTSPSP